MRRTILTLFALAMVVGGIVGSIVSHQTAAAGQTYYIYWGTIIVGLIGLGRALWGRNGAGKCYIGRDSLGYRLPVVMVPVNKVKRSLGDRYLEALDEPAHQRTLADVIYGDLRSHEHDWQSLVSAWEPSKWQQLDVALDKKGRPRYLAIGFDGGRAVGREAT